MRLEDHTEEFTNQVKDWAVMGLVPRQIAERLGLEGEERRAFMVAIMTDKHPLHEAYITARQHGIEDADTALITLADAGDTDALELLYKVRWQDNVNKVKKELFDV